MQHLRRYSTLLCIAFTITQPAQAQAHSPSVASLQTPATDRVKEAEEAFRAGCAYKGVQVACGPPGLQGGKNILYRNNGDGTFTGVSQKSGMWDTIGTYGLSVAVSDMDGDGWPDIYVANDSTAATFYQNQKDGTFKDVAIEVGIAYFPDGKPQAGMGVSIGDFNRDGCFDIVKTNFAGDTDSLYVNLGDENFDDTPTCPDSESTRAISAGRRFLRHGQRRLARYLPCQRHQSARDNLRSRPGKAHQLSLPQ